MTDPTDVVQWVILPDGRMDTKSAAAYLGLAEKTLAMQRSRGTGPRFVKRGRIWYFKADLDAWMQAGGRSTADQPAPQAGEPIMVDVKSDEFRENYVHRYYFDGLRSAIIDALDNITPALAAWDSGNEADKDEAYESLVRALRHLTKGLAHGLHMEDYHE